MKRLLRLLVIASVLAVTLVAPATAQAGTWQISQTPDTTGMTYQAGSWITVAWVGDDTIPADAAVSLMRSYEAAGVLYSMPVETGLGVSGSTEVQIPTAGGPYFYHIKATWVDAEGYDYDISSEAYWDWVFGTPWWFAIGNAPTVWGQPDAQTVALGETATFVASADGTPTPSVQWQVDTGYGWNDIDGATEGSYTTPEATADMNGWLYRAVFSNVCGTADSNSAQLTVALPQAVSISTPTVSPGAPRPRRDASFAATVSPAAAASAVGFTLHLLHWETRRVDGQRITDWYEYDYPSIAMSVTDVALGRIAGTGKLPVRGDWKMYVTSSASADYEAGSSPVASFTAR